MDVQSQMNLLEKAYLAGRISEKEYDQEMDQLLEELNRQ